MSSVTKLSSKILIPLLAIGLPLCGALLMMEVSLRYLGVRSAIIDAEMLSLVDDPLLPFRLRPGYRGVYDGGSVTVGADGNRVVSLPPRVDPNTLSREVVLLGDSVVFGQGVDDNDTIAANLQRAIVRTKAYRVRSIAAPGYTSWNEYAALSRYSNIEKVQTVVLIYVNNDITTDNDHFKLRETGGRVYYMQRDILHKLTHFLNAKSRLYFLASDSIKRAMYVIRSRLDATREPIVYSNNASAIVENEGFISSMEAIGKVRDLCRARGIDLLVGILRDDAIYRRPEQVSQYERAVSSGLSALGVNHFVLRWATDRLTKDQFGVSWTDGSHPSAIASSIMAEEIVTELEKTGY
jgi:hypothetical protein